LSFQRFHDCGGVIVVDEGCFDAWGEFVVAALAGYGCDGLGTAVGLKGFDDVFACSATGLWDLLVFFEDDLDSA
jgi:hypothetical protein